MKKNLSAAQKLKDLTSDYFRFDQIDGSHPWQDIMKDHVVMYPVRELNKGSVTYFNYRLAKEMGLIDKNHPQKMDKELEKKLIKTFSLQIINEFEQENKVKYSPSIVKKNLYMATRYLQIQHDSRSGKTSGDGRSIWNGYVQNGGKTWDISSRGTGVTKLAPGVVKADKFLQTGNEEFGYSCGQMEIDELYATAISSEIFHHNKIPTERVLAIIDLGKGVAIGVRAAPNLIRPAHLFIFLKQADHSNLKKALDYFIDRQIKNKEWSFTPGKNKYDQFLEHIVVNFSKFIARLDVDYIFAWMDWDGDNILANAGIIDYGSIRQFGLRHDQYRYDDVERFSTTLNEQKIKARQIVQVFAQMVDMIKTGKKKSISDFRDHLMLLKFDDMFKHFELSQRLYNIGLPKNDIEYLLANEKDAVREFEKNFKYFESIKTNRKTEKVADGINRPAIFNMRDFLREFPKKLLLNNEGQTVDSKTIFDIMLADNASTRDGKFKETYQQRILDLQNSYIKLLEKTRRKRSLQRLLTEVSRRAIVINRADRATGNAIIMIVEKIIDNIKQGFPTANIQELIEGYVASQLLVPKSGTSLIEILKRKKPETLKLLDKLFAITTEHKDEI